jgi:hypothetical protein
MAGQTSLTARVIEHARLLPGFHGWAKLLPAFWASPRPAVHAAIVHRILHDECAALTWPRHGACRHLIQESSDATG